MTGDARFAARFGRWAVVAGASEGLGAAFARALARRGMDLLVIARRQPQLEALAEALREDHGVEVRTLAMDLARPDFVEVLRRDTADLEVGLGIYNAAFAPVGDLVERSVSELQQVVDVNVRGPLLFARTLGEPMAQRKRGAIVIMSSLAGFQGTPRLAAYAASKAFGTTLAEGLWHELRSHGVHVLATCAGAVRTPGYTGTASGDAPGTLDAEVVVERTLVALHRGPRIVPGFVNAVAAWVLGRLLPRRLAVAIMASSTRQLQ